MNIIVCIDEKNGIGKNDNLLCRIPEDMKFFVEKTKNNIVVMGRKTLYSFKNKSPLKNRINIVFSKNKQKLQEEYANKNFKNLFFVSNEDELNEVLKKYEYVSVNEYSMCEEKKQKKNDVYIIGGESIYKMFIDKCDTLYITKIFQEFSADAFFPKFDNIGFVEVNKSDIKDYEGIKYQFIEYKK